MLDVAWLCYLGMLCFHEVPTSKLFHQAHNDHRSIQASRETEQGGPHAIRIILVLPLLKGEEDGD